MSKRVQDALLSLQTPIPKEAPELAGFFLSPKLKFYQCDGSTASKYAYGIVAHDFGMEIAKTLFGNAPFINDLSEHSSCKQGYLAFLAYVGVEVENIHSVKMRLTMLVNAIEMSIEYKGFIGGETIIIAINNPDKYANMIASEMEGHRAKKEGRMKFYGCSYAGKAREAEGFKTILGNTIEVILSKGETHAEEP